MLFLKAVWAKKGILSGRLNLGTVALRKLSTRRSRARALDRRQAIEEGDRLVVVLAAAELPGGVVFLLGVAGDGVEDLPELRLLG